MAESKLDQQVKTTVEVSIRLIFLFALIGWCLFLLSPFLVPVLWGAILAVAISPMYMALCHRFGNRPRVSAFLIVIVLLSSILIPFYFFVDSAVVHLKAFSHHLQQAKVIDIPPPNMSVKSWPIVGESIYDLWYRASDNLEEFLKSYRTELRELGKRLFRIIVGISGSVFQLLLSIIIAGILLATKGTREITQKFIGKLVGARGQEFVDLAEVTVRNVTKGILGVSLIQSAFLGLMFFLAGVPYAGVWALCCLLIGIMQLPPILVAGPIIIYIYSNTGVGMATFWAVILLLGTLIDNVLKPIFMGAGAAVPMLVIFLGAIGGFMLTGFIGLFTGAIVLSLGYRMLMSWLYEGEQEPTTT